MVTINASPERSLQLGYAGEDKVTKVIFPYDESWLEYGDGEFYIRVLRPGDTEPYNAQDVTNDSKAMTLTLVVTDVELSRQGYGQMQVVYIGPQVVKKSRIYAYRVSKAIDEPVDPPNGSIINQIVQSLGDLSDLTTTAKTDLVSAINEVNEHGGASVTVDSELSTTSTNPVQNKVVTSAVQSKADIQTVSALSDAVQDLDGDVQGLQTVVQSKVGDVQIDGTSIVSNGVANVPIATESSVGVCRVDPNYGTGIYAQRLMVARAPDDYVKNGVNGYRPIVPSTQHLASFYGLAKVAGHDEKNSTLPVGQYSDEAKIAIQKMLGIYEAPWELINEETFTNETSANYGIYTDSNGDALELTDAILLFETPQQETQAVFGGSGAIRHYFKGASFFLTNECSGYTQASNSSARGSVSILEQNKNMLHLSRISSAAVSNNGGYGSRYGTNFGESLGVGDRVSYLLLEEPIYINRIVIMAFTGTGHYRLYGKRKWQ